MKTAARIIKIAVTTLGLLFLCVMIYVWVCLAWIAFRPLPPIPRYGTQYSLQDRGTIGGQYLDVYGQSPLDWGWRLVPTGTVVHLGDAAAAADKAQRGAAAEQLSRRLGIEPKPDATYPEPSPVVSVSPRGHALIFQGDALSLWRDGQFADVIARKVRGYSWPIYEMRFHEINAQDCVIGNGRVATAGASSGGLSSPHGRYLPLVW